MDLKATTIETYDQNARAFEQEFDKFTRVKDIETTLALLTPRDAIHAFEIGCSYGRDGVEIAKCTQKYLGIDPSKEFIALARERHPALHFEVGDAESYKFPQNIDAAFAFASILHVSPEHTRDVFRRMHASLTDGGVFFLSLKRGTGEETKNDGGGLRHYFLYTPETLSECAGDDFEVASLTTSIINNRDWFEIAFRKK